jgi:hypothetical protein
MDNDRSFGGRHDAYLEEVAGVVWSHEHHEAFIDVVDADWVVERVEDRLIAHAVLPRARCDEGLIH